MFKFSLLLFLLFQCNYIFDFVKSQESPKVFLTAAKSVPRIGRSNKGNSEFEKFFLKASKSVPRIGRRNENSYLHPMAAEKALNDDSKFKYPTWSEIADRYEYEPEIFSPQYFTKFDEMVGDDPSVYDWEKVRMKRTTTNNKQSYE